MIIEWIALAAICAATAFLAVTLLSRRASNGPLGPSSNVDAVWIFDGSELLDATREASEIFGQPQGTDDWSDLRDKLASGFPGFPTSPSLVKANGQIIAPGSGLREAKEVICEWIDGITRVQLRNQPSTKRKGLGRAPRSDSEELRTLRVAINNAYYPVWRVDDDGSVSWFNAAYESLCMTVQGKKPGPDSGLFASQNEPPIPTKRARRSLTVPETGQKLWFDVSVVQTDAGTLCYAVNVNAVVEAEAAQRSFVQTLAKTFAQLSTGLAIFDRNRQLVLFNPALIDLTALPADFLSARPTLLSFFDRLRDQKMMPEPKNYGSWRDQMADLVEAAASGRYQETWSLPSGSVYSVSGRPHPDGAVAFLIEDITAEITLTRRFRSDLELGQAILDKIDDAIAVFSMEGNLTFSNKAYQKLWSVDPEKSFAQTGVLDAIRVWQERCMATPVWGDIRDFVVTQENRAEWWAKIALKSGDVLVCSIHPIHSGSTLINFSRSTETPAPIRETTLELNAD